MIRILTLLLLLLLPLPVLASEGSDLVFADRTPWSAPPGGLNWTVTRHTPQGDTRATLRLEEAADADGGPVLAMSEITDAGTRPLTRFPLSAGDPVVVYFLEAVTRDMAGLTGGSPFYIRNRIKDALRAGGTVAHRDGGATVTLHPFAGSENAARMAGFDTLSLRFDLGADASRPVRRLHAETSAPVHGSPYHLDLTQEEK